MQPASWYYHRLKSMSFGEIRRRIGDEFSDILHLIRIVFRWSPTEPGLPDALPGRVVIWPAARLNDVVSGIRHDWKQRLISDCNNILDGRLSYLNFTNVDMGNPIDWHIDRNSGVRPPRLPVYFVDYRDARRFGDCKQVWEPNRHHQLVILARGFKATGDERFADGVIDIIASWIDANPYGYGMNWRSPLELAIRVINWVWALDLIRQSNARSRHMMVRIRDAAYQHCFDITRKYSLGTSANNHLIGEAAGVFVASVWFGFNTAWITESRRILEEQIAAQSFDDGCTKELAIGYQYFVLQLLFAAALVARRASTPFSDDFLNRYRCMSDFMLTLAQGGNIPLFGDCDDGYVLDFGNRRDYATVIAHMQRALDERGTSGTFGAPACETGFWLGTQTTVPDSKKERKMQGDLKSVAFRQAGFYLLQSGCASVVFDCGDLGYKSIAAHGHADALSLILRISGHDMLIDPGTFDYFSFPQWRRYFRSTSAHNTVMVDNHDQSTMTGPFMWRNHAHCYCEKWLPTDTGGEVMGRHDGYMLLDDPVSHSRRVRLDGRANRLSIIDRLECAGEHKIDLYFHFAHDCRVERKTGGMLAVNNGDVDLTMHIPRIFTVDLITASQSGGGWQSTGYHKKIPTTTAHAHAVINGTLEFETSLTWMSERSSNNTNRRTVRKSVIQLS